MRLIMIKKFKEYFKEELKEFKSLKLSHPYGSKSIRISKIELESVCDKLKLDFNKLKFIS